MKLSNDNSNNMQPNTFEKFSSMLKQDLEETDPELYQLHLKEKKIQREFISFNSNDNIISRAVFQASSNLFVNKYIESYREDNKLRRFENMTDLLKITEARAKKLYKLDDNWSVNLAPVSGTQANLLIFLALKGKDTKILGLNTEQGGHYSFHYKPLRHQKSFEANLFHFYEFGIKENNELDYDEIEMLAKKHKPDILIAGAFIRSLDWDYKRLKEICDKYNMLLHADISHPAGLVSADLQNNPFPYCDIAMTVLQKTLSGPRAGIIFYKKNKYFSDSLKYGSTVMYGNPHVHVIYAVSVALKEALSPEYKRSMKLVQSTANRLCEKLRIFGFNVFNTTSHMLLIDLQNKDISAVDFEYLADQANMVVEQSSIYTCPNLYNKKGLRIGTSGLVRRGFVEHEMKNLAGFLNDIVIIFNENKNNIEETIQSERFKELKERIKNLALQKDFNY
ncbi:Serine hydroxymethyltransferase [Spraguea lophii 42_110]|uniref:Serine hydroxymethyltransferase n=1 Tax=Spraguea lophii (strain 42_110) TaxID=1358809 RepID=S7W987_SPRLO|nr:Serine hydroxymethyltransferase [Spraguea lophii 42_110]